MACLGKLFTGSDSGLWNLLSQRLGLHWGQSHWKYQSPPSMTPSVTSLLWWCTPCRYTIRLGVYSTVFFSKDSDKFLIQEEANIHPISLMTRLASTRGCGLSWLLSQTRKEQRPKSRPLDQCHLSHCTSPFLQSCVPSFCHVHRGSPQLGIEGHSILV